MQFVNRATLLSLLLFSSLPVWAAGGGEAKVIEGVQYVELKPAFVTNYGGPGGIHFLKADVTLRVEDRSAAEAVSHHMPQLRHSLVMLMSRQEGEALSSMEGKEQLRQEALTAVRQVLETEEGKAGVQDLLFTSFILQH